MRDDDDSGRAGSVAWPGGADFALFLSHDVDQVHDRGLYRTLADVNHLRRVLLGFETGSAPLCVRRIGRSILRPKSALRQFEALLACEARYGWKSSFFFLEGRPWARYGARYDLEEPVVRRIAERILESGGEIGVHGGYYDFNEAAGYRRSRENVERAFGVRPVGIRNHHLRLSGIETWEAQADAGFLYDATFGWNEKLGHRDGRLYPFLPLQGLSVERSHFVAIPLSIMDTTLFRYLGLSSGAALKAAVEVANETARRGGLLSLLWHNNFFDEPEYEEWQDVYEALLAHVASLKPWCATGAEIAAHWRGGLPPTGYPGPRSTDRRCAE